MDETPGERGPLSDPRVVHSERGPLSDPRVVHSEGDPITPLNRAQIFQPIQRSTDKPGHGKLYVALDEIVEQNRKFSVYKETLLQKSVAETKDDLDEEIRDQLALSRPRYEAAVKAPLKEIQDDIDAKQRQARGRATALQIISYLINLFIIAAGTSVTIIATLKNPTNVPIAILGGIITAVGTVNMLFKPAQKAVESFQSFISYSKLKNTIYEFYLDPPDDTEKLKTFMHQIHTMHETAAQGFFESMNVQGQATFSGATSNTLKLEP